MILSFKGTVCLDFTGIFYYTEKTIYWISNMDACRAKSAGVEAFAIPFDRQGLADYRGVDRSAPPAEISKPRREGMIESEKNRFRRLSAEGI